MLKYFTWYDNDMKKTFIGKADPRRFMGWTWVEGKWIEDTDAIDIYTGWGDYSAEEITEEEMKKLIGQ